MKINPTDMKGVYLIDTDVFRDERGEFFRTYSREAINAIQPGLDFIQHNHALNFRKGTWRGLHFQYPPFAETKLIRCLRGKVCDVVVDLRSKSPTFLEVRYFDLSAENKKMLLLPAGFAHGYITLEEQTELLYLHTSTYEPTAEGGLRFDDPALKIQLPIQVTLLSERDRSYPFITSDFKGIDL